MSSKFKVQRSKLARGEPRRGASAPPPFGIRQSAFAVSIIPHSAFERAWRRAGPRVRVRLRTAPPLPRHLVPGLTGRNRSSLEWAGLSISPIFTMEYAVNQQLGNAHCANLVKPNQAESSLIKPVKERLQKMANGEWRESVQGSKFKVPGSRFQVQGLFVSLFAFSCVPWFNLIPHSSLHIGHFKGAPLPIPLPARPSRGEGIRQRHVGCALVPAAVASRNARLPRPATKERGEGQGRGVRLILRTIRRNPTESNQIQPVKEMANGERASEGGSKGESRAALPSTLSNAECGVRNARNPRQSNLIQPNPTSERNGECRMSNVERPAKGKPQPPVPSKPMKSKAIQPNPTESNQNVLAARKPFGRSAAAGLTGPGPLPMLHG